MAHAAEIEESIHWLDNDLSGLTVQECELAAASGDESQAPQLNAMVPVLSRLRNAFGMEMVFVGLVSNGALTCRKAFPDEDCDPFEEAYGRGLLQARCGNSVFNAVAVLSHDGVEAGTLICGMAAADGYQPPPDSLKSVSRLLATSMRRMARA